ncbi:hypothetical protein [Burkholderia ubonensis]|uniref:hypothetical protein n=1 Tax=Burkholderia ubonensis TaxID=101571 RepID=UPI000A7618AA|nr:hypothetical protein [Burkholderia ubonensis]
MSAPRRRERDIPERPLSEMPALPSGMPGSSRVPVRIRAASAIQRDETFARRRFTRSPPEIRKKRVSSMTPIRASIRPHAPEMPLAFTLEKHAFKR